MFDGTLFFSSHPYNLVEILISWHCVDTYIKLLFRLMILSGEVILFHPIRHQQGRGRMCCSGLQMFRWSSALTDCLTHSSAPCLLYNNVIAYRMRHVMLCLPLAHMHTADILHKCPVVHVFFISISWFHHKSRSCDLVHYNKPCFLGSCVTCP